MYGRETIWDQAAGILTAAVGGYALESWQKASPGSAYPLITDLVALVGGAFGRRAVRHPMAANIMSALEYGGAWGAGVWVADATTTIGNNGPGAGQPYLPGQSASSSASTSTTDWMAPSVPTDLVQPLPLANAPVTPAKFTRRQVAV
jgi:hypothetical protein